MGRKVFKVYGTTCMAVCYIIRHSRLAVHRCETTAGMYRIGVGADSNISTSRQPYNTRRDETRKCLGRGLNKYLLPLVEACQEEESLQYDSFPDGRLAHCRTYRTHVYIKIVSIQHPQFVLVGLGRCPSQPMAEAREGKAFVLPGPAL
jgi:hypothetical protein